MAGQDKKTLLKDLIDSGKQKGKLSTKEINDVLEELDFDVEQVDKLYDTLESQNIEIIEDFTAPVDIELIPEEPEELENSLASEGINIDDPVKV